MVSWKPAAWRHVSETSLCHDGVL